MKKIIIIILLILSPIFVYANERVNVNIEYIDNVYWNYYRNGTLYSGQLAYIYVGDKIGYGINIREELNSSSYVRLDSEFTDSYIITMAYFGYGYNGEYTLKDYMATQKLIWKKTNSEEVYFTTGLNSTGSIINIDECIEKIYERYNNQAKFPNYGIGIKYLLGTTTKKNTKVSVSTPLKVINTTTNNISLDQNGNIVFVANEIGNNTFSLETNYISKSPNYKYISTGFQPIVTIGSSDVSLKKYYYEVIGGSININVKFNKDIGEKITNNEFKLYNSNDKLVGIYNPNEEGNIVINNLSADKYRLKHINISDGYNVDDKEYVFEINNSNLNINKEIILKLKTTKISICRTYGNIILNDIKYDSNVNYTIYDDNSNNIDEVKTNEKGYVEFNLDYGNYIIVESTENNIRKNTKDIIIDKTMFESDNHFDVHNYEYKTNLKIITLSKETNNNIGNVKFTINNEKYKTNEEGIFIIKNINFGIYEFGEINIEGFNKLSAFTYEINENIDFYIENNEPFTEIKLHFEKIDEKLDIEEKKEETIENEEEENELDKSVINDENSNIKLEEELKDNNTTKQENNANVKEEINNKQDLLTDVKDDIKDIIVDNSFYEELANGFDTDLDYNDKEEIVINEETKENNDDFVTEENVEKLPFLGENNIINEESKILYYIYNFIKFNRL